MTDPIADMLARIRNGIRARKSKVELPASSVKSAIARLLRDEGFVADVKTAPGKGPGILVITLQYDRNNQPAISGIRRTSRPGQRMYASTKNLPKLRGGLGTTILTTSKGLMTDRDARKQGVGGEIICQVW